MNILTKRHITIDYWVWEAKQKEAKQDEDALLAMKHDGKLLPHCGYVTIHFSDLELLKSHVPTD